MRYLVDTHIFVWYAKEQDRLSRDVMALLDDYDNLICISSETLRELLLLWRKKPEIRKYWGSPMDIFDTIKEENIEILYLHKEHYETYARLQTNEAQDHNDPSDHLIIAHAICNGIPLISDDDKFPFYRGQGLELIENSR